MAKIHHIFINYNVLTNNFHTYQLFTSSSPCFLMIVFPILPPPFLPSPPPFLAINDSLSSQLSLSFLLSAPLFPTIFATVSCQLSQSFQSVAPLCPTVFATLSCYLRHSILPAVPVFPTACVTLSSFLNRPKRVNFFRSSPILSTPFYVQGKALQHPRTCPS